MIAGKRVAAVMPAYNAELTLRQTVAEIDRSIIDDVVLVDDGSRDGTEALSVALGCKTFRHDRNYGYGRNQKTCYTEALKLGADVVIMLHPDYQYSPRLLPAMAALIASGEYDVALGSRILGGTALKGGMPFYKYISNRCLTFTQNLLMGTKLSEFHTGYRAFSAEVLQRVSWNDLSDDFVFDNEILARIHVAGYRIGEISCPTRYMEDSSSINFRRSVVYGLGVLRVSATVALHRLGYTVGVCAPVSAPAFDRGYYKTVGDHRESETRSR